ncbi:MAG: GNAT family N-acetyltransferase [Actinobacteria bacterium]|nr:GNAT family N-acetyltransferase [Actinomycetota bacterium]
MSDATVLPLARARVREAAAMLARSFDDDPLSLALFPGPRRRKVSLRSFMAATMRDALRHGEVWAALDGSQVVGIAAWLGEGAYPLTPPRVLRQAGAALVALLTPQTLPLGTRLIAETQAAHPKEPHWYLAVLGVDPAHQGRGIGGVLLRPVLQRLDRQERPAYLETSKERNIAWYGRQGFELTGTLEVRPGAPPIWTMWRAPRAVPAPP